METKVYDLTNIAVQDASPASWLTPILEDPNLSKNIKNINVENVGNVRYYHANENSGKPRVLVILGLNRNFEIPDSTFKSLDPSYEILCMENIGHGNTSPANKKDYSCENFANAIYQFLRVMKWVDVKNKFSIFAWSFGAQICTELMIKPQLLSSVNGLILMTPTGISMHNKFTASMCKVPGIATFNNSLILSLANIDPGFSDMPFPIQEKCTNYFNKSTSAHQENVIDVTKYVYTNSILEKGQKSFISLDKSLAALHIPIQIVLTYSDRTVCSKKTEEFFKEHAPYLYKNLVKLDGYHNFINQLPLRAKGLLDEIQLKSVHDKEEDEE